MWLPWLSKVGGSRYRCSGTQTLTVRVWISEIARHYAGNIVLFAIQADLPMHGVR
jgi:hypothetical protein